jgi:hypothetical protein
VVEIVKLGTIFEIFDDEVLALQAFARPDSPATLKARAG